MVRVEAPSDAEAERDGEVMLLDWLCYQFVRWFPVWKLNPKGRIYGGFILPRCGNWIYRDWQRE